jgi:anaerobic dimethyl sulfoxide reductase subunit B (iron-sulfur subunit)
MQVGFYFDQTRCTGCGACQVACKDWNDIPAGPEKWMRVLYTERGEAAHIFVSYLAVPCYQCLDPVCMPACPVGAITKRKEDGIVLVDQAACLGNEACDEKCRKACPYDAPQFGPEPGAKMGKCDFCSGRWQQQQLPVCVEACPTRAFDAGRLNDIESRYGDIKEADSFKYSSRTKPAVVFKRKFL